MQEITPLLLQEITERLVKEFQPEEIILFGSYAWGTPDKDSDLDLLIVVSDSDLSPARRASPQVVNIALEIADLIGRPGYAGERDQDQSQRQVLFHLDFPSTFSSMWRLCTELGANPKQNEGTLLASIGEG